MMSPSAIQIFFQIDQEASKDANERDVKAIEASVPILMKSLFKSKTVDPDFLKIAKIAEKTRTIYNLLGEKSEHRHLLLSVLTIDRLPEGLSVFTDLMVEDPPTIAQQSLPAFAALFQNPTKETEHLFPRLLDAIEHQQIAAMILDLANHYVRLKILSEHPAKNRLDQLATLFSSLVQRLHIIGSQPLESGIESKKLPETIDESASLVVALVNTFSLIGDEKIIGKLRQALELRHRRINTEVAAALARFQQDEGIEQLILMAKEPVVRQRALFHLEELDLLEQVDEQYKTAEAQAEGALASWLAGPLQFGFPPQEIELFDQCEQFWPGFDEKQACYLFRYTYHMPNGELTGIGIAGPVTYSLPVDLQDYPPADIYAAFMGWQAEHEAISEIADQDLAKVDRDTYNKHLADLENNGYCDIQLIKKGSFFDETHWIIQATRNEQSGSLVIDQRNYHWFPSSQSSQPLGPNEAYMMHKGRLLLAQFNP